MRTLAEVKWLKPYSIILRLRGNEGIGRKKQKRITPAIIRKAAIIITMGCGVEECPVVPKESENWHIEDPSGKLVEVFRRIRDEIAKRVEALLLRLEN